MQGVFVGNVSRAKGVDVLLEAMSKCGAECRITFVGGGPDLATMQELAAKLGLADRVAWLGQRPSGDIPDLLRGTDFLVLPSLSEGRPNVVMEAMATGLPVIATDVGSTRELLDDGRGLLVAPGNTGELAAALERLCADTTLRPDSRPERAAVHLRNNLTWDSTAAQFEIYFSGRPSTAPIGETMVAFDTDTAALRHRASLNAKADKNLEQWIFPIRSTVQRIARVGPRCGTGKQTFALATAVLPGGSILGLDLSGRGGERSQLAREGRKPSARAGDARRPQRMRRDAGPQEIRH